MMQDMGKLMQQAQRIQSEMQKKQEELDSMSFTGTAGGGMAEACVNGKLEVTSIKVMPEAVDPRDVEMLEDVILAAIQEAQKKGKEKRDQEMAGVTGGLKIPGLFG
jgi:DNA-binding YbaB/EbfC family protein